MIKSVFSILISKELAIYANLKSLAFCLRVVEVLSLAYLHQKGEVKINVTNFLLIMIDSAWQFG